MSSRLANRRAAHPSTSPAPAGARGRQGEGRSLARILLIEDDPRIARFVRRGLEAEGYAVEVADNGEDGLDQTFEDVATFAAMCRFRDCRHEGEPGCAVTKAVTGGDLDEARLGSYRKLQRELAYLVRRQDEWAAAEEKRRWKRIHKAMRRGGKRL